MKPRSPIRTPATREYHILNLGAGVQSTALYLLSMEGRIQRFDAAVFADTQDEPGAEERRLGLPDPPESVYAHLDWLISLNGPLILVRTRGADQLRFASGKKHNRPAVCFDPGIHGNG